MRDDRSHEEREHRRDERIGPECFGGSDFDFDPYAAIYDGWSFDRARAIATGSASPSPKGSVVHIGDFGHPTETYVPPRKIAGTTYLSRGFHPDELDRVMRRAERCAV